MKITLALLFILSISLVNAFPWGGSNRFSFPKPQDLVYQTQEYKKSLEFDLRQAIYELQGKLRAIKQKQALGGNSQNGYILNPRFLESDQVLNELAYLFVQSGFDFDTLKEALQVDEDNLLVLFEQTVRRNVNNSFGQILRPESSTVFATVDEEGKPYFSGVEDNLDFLLYANRYGCNSFQSFDEERKQQNINTLCLFGLTIDNEKDEKLLYIRDLKQYCAYCKYNMYCLPAYKEICEDLSSFNRMLEVEEGEQFSEEDIEILEYNTESKKIPAAKPMKTKKQELFERIRIEEIYINKESE